MNFSGKDIVIRIDHFLVLKNEKRKAVCDYAGIALQTITDWTKRGSIPASNTLFMIAEYLGTTVEYLLTGKDSSGYSPEIIEIARKMAALSPEDRQDILDFIDIKLTRTHKGVDLDNKKEEKPMQAVAVKEPEPAYLGEPLIPVRSEIIDSVIFLDWGVVEIPLLGTTAAGHPIDFGDIDPDPPTRKWSSDLIKGDPSDYYCVAIRGQSMIEADIKDGDHALLRRVYEPKQGEIMLVRHDNASTLKRIRIVEGANGQREVYICWEDGSKHEVRLDDEEYEIQGLLIAIERKPGKR